MWELDYKESWASKNWCFWTVVLEKTLESPLDCKEIKPVSPKGHEFWIFTGRTDAEPETPILWPPDAKNWLTGKDSDARKDWRWEEKGMTEDEMVDASLTRWTWVWVSFRSWWWTGKPGMLHSLGSQRDRHDWATELTELRPDLPSNTSNIESNGFKAFHQAMKNTTPWVMRHKWGQSYDWATLLPWENFQEEQWGKIQIKLSRSSEVMHLKIWKSKISRVLRTGYRKGKCCLRDL